VILVTGAGGMLGREVVRAAPARGVECVGLAHGELDITDAAAVRAALHEYSPDTVINCAGWTDVDSAEAHEDEALAINRDGTAVLASEASARMARLIHVSTDYVFDGTATRPYVESDPTGPSTAYGRTKLAGERAALASSPMHAVARTAWIFGTGRSNFVTFVLDQAAAGRPVQAFTDQFGCPTYTGHLAEKLLDIARDGACGILHEVAAGYCSRFELAHAILEAAGLGGTVQAVSRVGQGANRPAWSVLASERDGEPLPPWPDGLDAYLAQMRAAA
jgi:dTDP-4-dehydrorhamnose reductase